ncbi:MAG: hypothetical protein MJ175_08345 [Clostridia bacterium]|nr:hypothetical protein [Clostridia bacterium]
MKPLSSLSMLSLGIFSSWQMILFWGSVYILILGSRDRRWVPPVLRNVLLLFLCLVNYTLFQCTVSCSSPVDVTPAIIAVTDRYAELPVCGVFAVCVLLTTVEILLILFLHRWYNTHITSASIKETIETLPVGICAFEPDGKITLRNRTMEQLCRGLTGSPLLNGNEFVVALKEKKSGFTDFSISLPDLGVWSFTKDEIHDGSTRFTLLIAHNMTEAYQKTQMLANRQKTVKELNEKLIEYNKQIEHIITQQEILHAKIHIHDELGSGLLAIRRCLISGGSGRERADLMERLRGNIRFLQQEAVSEEQDEYALILSTARNLGVSVQINGVLPKTEPCKHITATAIHECFTNIIRHTNGDTLHVTITEDEHTVTAQFTDNNTLPAGEITEIGGLRSLRDLTERAGGEMQITALPRFCLTMTLPKEIRNYDLPCFDRR